MIIRMRTRIAGPDFAAAPGDVISVSDDRARALIAGGYAESVDQQKPVIERAVLTATETPEIPRKGRK